MEEFIDSGNVWQRPLSLRFGRQGSLTGSRGRYELESPTSTNPVSTNQAPVPKGSVAFKTAWKVQFKCSEHEPVGDSLNSNDNIVPNFFSSK